MSDSNKLNRNAVLVSSIASSFFIGITYVWSVVSKRLVSDFKWTSLQASMPYTIATIMIASTMVFAGRIQDIKGPRFTGTIGGLLMGSGLILSGFVKSPALMVLTFGITYGIGNGFLSVSNTPPALKWFPPEKKGLISGIVIATIGISSAVYAPIINALSSNFGIENTFLIVGSCTLILSVSAAQLTKNPPLGYVAVAKMPVSIKIGSKITPGKDYFWKDMIKTPIFHKLLIMYIFSSSAGLMIIGHISAIAVKQAAWENGFLLVVLISVFNAAGRLSGGTISDLIGRINVLRIAFSLQALNMLCFKYYNSAGLLAFGAAVCGFCYGAAMPIFPIAIADYFGLKNLGANTGIMALGWGIAGIMGPIIAANIVDSTGNYYLAYIISLILLIIAGAVALTFNKKLNMPSRKIKSLNI